MNVSLWTGGREGAHDRPPLLQFERIPAVLTFVLPACIGRMVVGCASGARSLETGCWVYLVLPGNSIGVRSLPSIEDDVRTGVGFAPGELVSVDLIQETEPTSNGSSGPFLKLSDHSGWLFERKQGEELMKRVPVTDGLWIFYAHNPPTGIALRSHPVDRSEVKIKIKTGSDTSSLLFSPTQKICCDKKVSHPSTGLNYYRVQGTRGWVFDRRGDTRMLLDEGDVHMGLFAYRALESICIRAWATTEDCARMEVSVKTHDVVVGDMTLDCDPKNGPFVHLTGCGGWLFEKYANSKMFEPLPIDSGSWKLRVENSVGIGLRAQPIDEGSKFSTIYKQNSIVSCDKRIRSPVTGVNFYRVTGTQGWVFDRRGDKIMMTLLSTDPMVSGFQDLLEGSGDGWSPDFVRGIASTVEGVEEISYNETSRVISFRSNCAGARINVYYTTRTVGTALDHPLQGKTQLFRRNCDPVELQLIFENPRIHTDKGYQRNSSGPTQTIAVGADFVVDSEAEARHDLFACEQELRQLKSEAVQTTRQGGTLFGRTPTSSGEDFF